jgi:hypothetical protein
MAPICMSCANRKDEARTYLFGTRKMLEHAHALVGVETIHHLGRVLLTHAHAICLHERTFASWGTCKHACKTQRIDHGREDSLNRANAPRLQAVSFRIPSATKNDNFVSCTKKLFPGPATHLILVQIDPMCTSGVSLSPAREVKPFLVDSDQLRQGTRKPTCPKCMFGNHNGMRYQGH